MTVRIRRADRVCMRRVGSTRARMVRVGAKNGPSESLAGADERVNDLGKSVGDSGKGVADDRGRV